MSNLKTSHTFLFFFFFFFFYAIPFIYASQRLVLTRRLQSWGSFQRGVADGGLCEGFISGLSPQPLSFFNGYAATVGAETCPPLVPPGQLPVSRRSFLSFILLEMRDCGHMALHDVTPPPPQPPHSNFCWFQIRFAPKFCSFLHCRGLRSSLNTICKPVQNPSASGALM